MPPNEVVAVHPTQLYEVTAGFIMFLILWRYRRKARHDGEVAALFLFLYGAGRFLTEFLRGDPRAHVLGLSLPQVFWMITAGVAAAFLLRARLRGVPTL